MTQYPELRVPNAENYVSRDLAIIFTSEWAFLYHYPDSIWALITYKGTAERWSNRCLMSIRMVMPIMILQAIICWRNMSRRIFL